MDTNKKNKINRGLTLLEVVIYIALFAFLLVLVVNVLLSLSTTFVEVSRLRALAFAGNASLERISREIRDASSIDGGGSVFGEHPGELILEGEDVDGNERTIHFFLDADERLYVEENSGSDELLSGENIRVSNLIFYDLSGVTSSAVKIEMTLENDEGRRMISENFYDTIVLRGSYE